jgi:hypothetical protein
MDLNAFDILFSPLTIICSILDNSVIPAAPNVKVNGQLLQTG